MNRIDKSKPIPLYYQIKENITEKISSGELLPGDRLPTEAWFSEAFGVSRVTVRKAIDELISDGTVRRERGKAPVISNPKINRRFNKLSGLGNELSSQGISNSSKLLRFEECDSSADDAGRLSVSEGAPIIKMQRLQYAEGKPLAIQNILLRRDAYSDTGPLQAGGSAYEGFSDPDIKVSEATQTISARLPSASECRQLQIESTAPVLIMQRTTYLSDGSVVEYAETAYIAYKYNITITLYP